MGADGCNKESGQWSPALGRRSESLVVGLLLFIGVGLKIGSLVSAEFSICLRRCAELACAADTDTGASVRMARPRETAKTKLIRLVFLAVNVLTLVSCILLNQPRDDHSSG